MNGKLHDPHAKKKKMKKTITKDYSGQSKRRRTAERKAVGASDEHERWFFTLMASRPPPKQSEKEGKKEKEKKERKKERKKEKPAEDEACF